jgi:hypothetical protein
MLITPFFWVYINRPQNGMTRESCNGGPWQYGQLSQIASGKYFSVSVILIDLICMFKKYPPYAFYIFDLLNLCLGTITKYSCYPAVNYVTPFRGPTFIDKVFQKGSSLLTGFRRTLTKDPPKKSYYFFRHKHHFHDLAGGSQSAWLIYYIIKRSFLVMEIVIL